MRRLEDTEKGSTEGWEEEDYYIEKVISQPPSHSAAKHKHNINIAQTEEDRKMFIEITAAFSIMQPQ